VSHIPTTWVMPRAPRPTLLPTLVTSLPSAKCLRSEGLAMGSYWGEQPGWYHGMEWGLKYDSMSWDKILRVTYFRGAVEMLLVRCWLENGQKCYVDL